MKAKRLHNYCFKVELQNIETKALMERKFTVPSYDRTEAQQLFLDSFKASPFWRKGKVIRIIEITLMRDRKSRYESDEAHKQYVYDELRKMVSAFEKGEIYTRKEEKE